MADPFSSSTRRSQRHSPLSIQPNFLFLTLILFLLTFTTTSTHAIKLTLPASKTPPAKCIWNAAHPDQLVIVTANVGVGEKQRVDIEIVDSSDRRNQYLSKKNINGETRLAVTAHAEGEVGVCIRNYLDKGMFMCIATTIT
jgi:biopolymer transport protein ExbD